MLHIYHDVSKFAEYCLDLIYGVYIPYQNTARVMITEGWMFGKVFTQNIYQWCL